MVTVLASGFERAVESDNGPDQDAAASRDLRASFTGASKGDVAAWLSLRTRVDGV
jgi:hypothetical protein